MNTNDSILQLSLAIILLAIGIIATIVATKKIKKCIREKLPFSGIGWGAFLGIFPGVGIVPVIIAEFIIDAATKKIKNKKYHLYAEKQMRDFAKIFYTCVVIWVIIGFSPLIGIIVGLVAMPLMLNLCLSKKVEYPVNASKGINQEDNDSIAKRPRKTDIEDMNNINEDDEYYDDGL